MSSISRHSAYLMAAYFATAGLNYILGVGLSWFFTPAEYGIQGVAQSLLLLLALVVGSGFAWTAAYEVAAEKDPELARRRFRTAWLANLALGLLMALGIWLAYSRGWMDLGPDYAWIVPLVGLTVVLLGVRAVANGAMRGMYRFGDLAVNLTAEVVVKLVVSLVLVALGWGVTGVMVGFVAGAAVSLGHSYWVIRPAKLFSGQGWIEIGVFKQTLPLFISMLGTALMLNLDVLGLKILSPASVADTLSGYYQAAVILARTPVFLAQAITMVLFSYVAGKGVDLDGLNFQALRLTFQPWLRFLLPAGLVLVAAPGAILRVFFPPQYQSSAPFLQLAATGGLLLALISLINGLLQAQGQRHKSAAVTAVATLAQILVLIWLVPGMGPRGAALSLVVAGGVGLVGYLALFMPLIVRGFRNPVRAGVSLGGARHFIPLAGMLVSLALVPGETWTGAFVKLALAGLVYIGLLILIENRSFDRRQPGAWVGQLIQVVIGG